MENLFLYIIKNTRPLSSAVNYMTFHS